MGWQAYMTRTVCDICTFAGLFNFQSLNLFIVYKAKIKSLRMSAVFLLDQRKIACGGGIWATYPFLSRLVGLMGVLLCSTVCTLSWLVRLTCMFYWSFYLVFSSHSISIEAVEWDVNRALFCFQLMVLLQDREQGMRNHCLLGTLLLLQENWLINTLSSEQTFLCIFFFKASVKSNEK